MVGERIIGLEEEVLLALLRAGLGIQVYIPFQAEVDWTEVMRMSYKHKVSGIAADGLKASGITRLSVVNDPSEGDMRAILNPWLDDLEKMESGYCYYVDVLNTLCQLFVSNGLKPVVLKGYGLGLNYPIPSHRGVGDIDIYLLDENGKNASEAGMAMIYEMFHPEMNHKCHHCEFPFKGVDVEIHNDITNSISKSEEEKLLQAELKKMISEETVPCGLFSIPSVDFNAILQVRHMFTHFFAERINLRQLTDWYCFLRNNSSKINWDRVLSHLDSVDHLPLFHAINGFIVAYLGLKPCLVPDISVDDSFINELARTVFKEPWRESEGISRLASYFRNRKKIYLLSGESWVLPAFRSIRRHIQHNTQNPYFSNRYD